MSESLQTPDAKRPPNAGYPPGEPDQDASFVPSAARPVRPAQRHTFLDDAQALLTGTLFVAFGVVLFKHAGLLSGGMAGLAFLLHYGTGLGFGAWFFLLNVPFYWLAWRRMGRAFTIKTFCSVGLVSLFSELLPRAVSFAWLDPMFAAVMGGLVMGAGFLMLFRHRASLGGVGILALVLQERRGWRAGQFQLAVDCVILLAALVTVPLPRVALSVAGAVALNLILAINFRPGRYVAV